VLRSIAALIFLPLFVMAAPARAEERPVPKGDTMEETDNLSVATLLVQDGFLDRAAAVLEGLDPAAETLDQKRYWRLRGLVEMRRQNLKAAAEHFELAILEGDAEPRLYLLLAQCQVASEQARAAARTLDKAPAGIAAMPESFLVRAQAQWALGASSAAFLALEEGHQRFPDDERVARQRMFMLVQLGLHQAAVEAGRALFARGGERPEDYLALAEALRKAGQGPRAILLLEEATLRFGDDPELRTQLAATYLGEERPVAAAEVLRPLAFEGGARAFQAAELYKRGGLLGRALRMNERVADQPAKLRQRLGILIEEERYEGAAALMPRVARLGLLEDEAIAYAMAYAFFKTKDFQQAEELLGSLADPELFKKGIELRRAMDACRQAEWTCD
jgi:predicted Zn-dependent protease